MNMICLRACACTSAFVCFFSLRLSFLQRLQKHFQLPWHFLQLNSKWVILGFFYMHIYNLCIYTMMKATCFWYFLLNCFQYSAYLRLVHFCWTPASFLPAPVLKFCDFLKTVNFTTWSDEWHREAAVLLWSQGLQDLSLCCPLAMAQSCTIQFS